MANTVTYNRHDYVVKLRERLNLPVNWADILKVKYSDVRTIVNSRLSTEPADTGGTRGTAATLVGFALTADTLTIDTYRDLFVFIDEADRHQQSYVSQMEIAHYQGLSPELCPQRQSVDLVRLSSYVDIYIQLCECATGPHKPIICASEHTKTGTIQGVFDEFHPAPS